MPPARRAQPKASHPLMPPGFGSAVGGKRLMPWSWAAERLVNGHNYFVVTVRPDGRPHAVPVWGCWMDDRFYFSTDRATVKARNLSANPHCIVCPEDGTEAVIVEGVAREISDKAILRRVAALYEPKYEWKLEITEGTFYEVRPSVVLGFSENAEDFAASATRWKFADKPATLSRRVRQTARPKRATAKKKG